jgi:nucleoside-diphosphate-sugar epimerase
MTQNVLLTGASGSIGYEVFQQLLKAQIYNITIFVRKSRKNINCFKAYGNQVNILFGDLTKKEDLSQICEPYDTVIHLAAIIPPIAYKSESSTFKVNVLATQLLIHHFETYCPKAFFMFSSSVAIYGDRLKNPDIRVTDPLHDDDEDFYVQSKINAEEFVQQSRLNWTIFRLTAILGVNNHKITGLMFHMPLDTQMEITTPSDAARAFVNGTEQKSLLSKKIFNLGGGASFRTSYKELLAENFKMNGLGALDFPEKTFAEKNFHCGYMMDSDDLEVILHYREHTLADYYRLNREAIPIIRKLLTIPFRGLIKFFLRQMSEPLRAYKRNNKKEMQKFF